MCVVSSTAELFPLTNVRTKTLELLDRRQIKVTSIDFVRFTWSKTVVDTGISPSNEDDGDAPPGAGEAVVTLAEIENEEQYFTNPTIWIGVIPDTLTGAVAHESSKDIRALLDSLQVQKVDIAYRESVYKPLRGHGPALYPPAKEGDPIKDVDNVSVASSLVIAARKTSARGTLGPYFHCNDKLYAITARHNVYSSGVNYETYRYCGASPRNLGSCHFLNAACA